MAEQWEHKVVPASGGLLSEGDMNHIGAQGWELVSVIQRVGGKLSNGFGDIGTTVTLVFKRRKQS